MGRGVHTHHWRLYVIKLFVRSRYNSCAFFLSFSSGDFMSFNNSLFRAFDEELSFFLFFTRIFFSLDTFRRFIWDENCIQFFFFPIRIISRSAVDVKRLFFTELHWHPLWKSDKWALIKLITCTSDHWRLQKQAFLSSNFVCQFAKSKGWSNVFQV